MIRAIHLPVNILWFVPYENFRITPANWGAQLNYLLVGTRIDAEKFKDSTSGHGKQWYPHALYIFELCISLIDDSINIMSIYLYVFKFL